MTGLLKQKIALTDAAGKTGLAQLASAIRQAMTDKGQKRSNASIGQSSNSTGVSYTFYPLAYRILGLIFENVCPELLGGIVLGKWNVRNRLAHEPT